jgi:peptidoglycan/LPS O-acetylase OafA/YrhL
LVQEFETTGTIFLASFYARHAKRLFPATAVLLVASTALVLAIGNVRVYRQGKHLTATSVETLAPRLGAALTQAMGDRR